MLYVLGSHGVQLLAPVGENVPAEHHAHARYELAPSCVENVPLGHG